MAYAFPASNEPSSMPLPSLPTRSRAPRSLALALALAGGLFALGGCSIRRLAINGIAGALASGGDVFATDDDPEFVREALPFGLKTLEALIAASPDNVDLRVAACRGFTQYAYAFLDADAELAEVDDYEAAVVLQERALRMYLRARDYGLGALELQKAGTSAALATDPQEALSDFGAEQVPALFWTGLSWGAAVSAGVDRPEIVADVDAVRALLRRCLELDEGFEVGGVHQAMMRIESLPEMMGGSPERAREHFERAVELSSGHDASPYVTFATSVSVAAQDRATFTEMLNAALAIDPDAEPRLRLSNRIEQRRAEHLLSVADDLFLEPLE